MTQAKEFIDFMDKIWESSPWSNPYKTYHNARRTAENFSAARLYSWKNGSESGYAYVFPDKSKVWIGTNGASCKEIGLNHRREPHNIIDN